MATDTLYRLGAELKICSHCNIQKLRSDFPKSYASRVCFSCQEKELSLTPKEGEFKTVEERRAYRRQWAANNRDKVSSYAEKHNWFSLTDEQRERKSKKAKIRHLERKYGMTQADWDAMYAAQGGVCAICKVPGRVGKHGKLAVDHCHATGRVRGLLCTPCNVSIGILGETPEQWEVVLKYLKGG